MPPLCVGVSTRVIMTAEVWRTTRPDGEESVQIQVPVNHVDVTEDIVQSLCRMLPAELCLVVTLGVLAVTCCKSRLPGASESAAVAQLKLAREADLEAHERRCEVQQAAWREVEQRMQHLFDMEKQSQRAFFEQQMTMDREEHQRVVSALQAQMAAEIARAREWEQKFDQLTASVQDRVHRDIASQLSLKDAEIDLLRQQCARSDALHETQLNALRQDFQAERERLSGKFHEEQSALHKRRADEALALEDRLREKDQLLKRASERYEECMERLETHVTKNSTRRGVVGEATAQVLLCDAFRDFPRFECQDRHALANEGDFHLLFEPFRVMVDVKNYERKVPRTEREKLMRDLARSPQFSFAWMVSLHSGTDKFDRAAIMLEWRSSTQCVVYINRLLEDPDPSRLLRVAWFMCLELLPFIRDHAERERLRDAADELGQDELTLAQSELARKQVELSESVARHGALVKGVHQLRSRVRDLTTSVNRTQQLVTSLSTELTSLVAASSEQVLDAGHAVFDEWWAMHVRVSEGGMEEGAAAEAAEFTWTSTRLWDRFKSTSGALIAEFELTPDKFRDFLLARLPPTCMMRKPNQKTIYVRGITCS